MDAIDRRAMLGVLGLATAVGSIGGGPAVAAPVAPSEGSIRLHGRTIRFADLTHRLTRAFGFGQTPPRIALEPVEGSGAKSGMNLNRLSLVEHSGTHIDAPRHFDDDGLSLGDIPLGDLIVPLAVIDMRDRFAADKDATVQPQDIERWEKRHGRLPERCCVAMLSGIDPLTDYPALFGGAGRPVQGPGFGAEAATMLISDRSVKGVAVDGMSIDTGPNMPAYPFHREWLRSGRWGIEAIANLAAVPPTGAILFVGAPPLAEATGMPIRVAALF